MMECAFNAHNLISISLRKIQNFKTQRGGIKLHRNLLITCVLKHISHFHMNADCTPFYSRPKQYEAFRPVFTNHECLKDSGNSEELTGELYCRFREDNSDTEHRGSPLLDRHRVGLPALKGAPLTVSSHRNNGFEGCFLDPCSQDFADWNTQSKTFLDLDTQMLTSVGCTHPPICVTGSL